MRAPLPDALDNTPPRPAAEPSQIAAVARIPWATLNTALSAATVKPVELGQSSPLGSWKLTVSRGDPSSVGAEGELVCVRVPVRADGHVAAFGRKLGRSLAAVVKGCARPRLSGAGAVTLAEPRVQVDIAAAGSLALNTAVLRETLTKHLHASVAPQIKRLMDHVAVPIDGALTPLTTALSRPLSLGKLHGQAACLVLRAERLEVAQPDVEPGGLRLSVALHCRPTVEVPCREPSAPGPSPGIETVATVQHQPTRLLLPVEMPLVPAERDVDRALHKRGPIKLQGGALTLGKVRLATSKGLVLVHVDVGGTLASSVLGFSVQKQVRGGFAVWGKPDIQRGDVVLSGVGLALDSDDKLTEIAAALARERIAASISAQVKIPRARIEKAAREQLGSLSKGIAYGGARWPVRVDTKRLAIASVTATGGRLVVLVAFEGWIVVGDTRLR